MARIQLGTCLGPNGPRQLFLVAGTDWILYAEDPEAEDEHEQVVILGQFTTKALSEMIGLIALKICKVPMVVRNNSLKRLIRNE